MVCKQGLATDSRNGSGCNAVCRWEQRLGGDSRDDSESWRAGPRSRSGHCSLPGSEAAVSVAPLRYGAGMKGKVVEALDGVPVVATSVGIRGLSPRNGLDLEVADEADQFAGAVIRLLQDRELAERIGLAGQQLAAALCDPDRIARNIEEMLNLLVPSRSPSTRHFKWLMSAPSRSWKILRRRVDVCKTFDDHRGVWLQQPITLLSLVCAPASPQANVLASFGGVSPICGSSRASLIKWLRKASQTLSTMPACRSPDQAGLLAPIRPASQARGPLRRGGLGNRLLE